MAPTYYIITNSISHFLQLSILKQNTENIPTDNFQNKTLQIIKTVKTQQSTQNFTTPDDDQKYGQKCLHKRYEIIPLPMMLML